MNEAAQQTQSKTDKGKDDLILETDTVKIATNVSERSAIEFEALDEEKANILAQLVANALSEPDLRHIHAGGYGCLANFHVIDCIYSAFVFQRPPCWPINDQINLLSQCKPHLQKAEPYPRLCLLHDQRIHQLSSESSSLPFPALKGHFSYTGFFLFVFYPLTVGERYPKFPHHVKVATRKLSNRFRALLFLTRPSL